MIVARARYDIVASVRSFQVSAGHEVERESLTHAMRAVYKEQSAEAVLVDASKAFNSANRNAFLHNVEIMCQSIARHI